MFSEILPDLLFNFFRSFSHRFSTLAKNQRGIGKTPRISEKVLKSL